MKKIIFMIICLALILNFPGALASQFPDFPFEIPGEEDRTEPSSVSEAIQIHVNGQTQMLNFDPSAEFSYARNGLVQASFYAYSPEGKYLYEVYMTFPETVSSGTVFTTDNALQAGLEDCCIAFLISTQTTEDYYLAAQHGQDAYPEGTSYAIRFDSVSSTSSGTVYSGALTATMVGMDINNVPIAQKFIFSEAPFSFTLPSGMIGNLPGEIPMPSPVPTVRPDMFRI